MNDLRLRRIGFYPVSARDYLGPLQMLKGYVDHLIFCDVAWAPNVPRGLRDIREAISGEGLPEASFLLGDAIAAMDYLQPVDLLFLRRDSGDGEGGSGLYLLGRERLPKTLSMISPGGLLVTDQRNGGDWFRAMVSRSQLNMQVGGRMLQLATEQPWADQALYSFEVNKT